MATSCLKGFSVIILVLVAVFPPKLCCLEIDVDPRNYGQDTMQPAHSSKTGALDFRVIFLFSGLRDGRASPYQLNGGTK